MNFKYLFMIISLALLTTNSAFAVTKNSDNEKLFREFDQNKDNIISIVEADRNTWLFSQFDKLDTNHDEKLEKSEFYAYTPENRFEPPVLTDPGIGAAPLND